MLADRIARLIESKLGPARPWVGVADAALHLAWKPQRMYEFVS